SLNSPARSRCYDTSANCFQSHDESDLARIVDIQFGRLEQRLAQQNLALDVDAATKSLLAKEGYDPQFGARPHKRAIQEHVSHGIGVQSSTSPPAPKATARLVTEVACIIRPRSRNCRGRRRRFDPTVWWRVRSRRSLRL